MRYKKIMILTIILACLLAVSAVSAAENVTDGIISVNVANEDVVSVEETDDVVSVKDNNYNSVDDLNYLSAKSDGTFTDLANEIDNANDNLNLTKNYVFDSSIDSKYKNGITINKKITINGKGFVINGNNQVRAFNVAQSDVTLKNIRFTNCYSSSNGGGAVSWTYSNGSLFDCNFVDCHSDYSGGAVLWSGVKGSLFDCNFADCYSNSSAGAVSWSGVNGSLFDCNFADCYSLNYGGAVSWSGNGGNLSRCSFEDCYISLSKSLSIGNTKSFSSSSSGGAVYWTGDDGNLVNSSFENCYSSNSIYYSFSTTSIGTITSTGISQAGAIHWDGKNGNVINSSFKKCYSKSYNYCNSYGSSTCSNTNSYSYCNGGAIFWADDNGNLINSHFEDCYGSSSSYGLSNRRIGSAYSYCRGGNIYWMGENGNVINSTFKNYHCSSFSYCSSDGTKSSSSTGDAIHWHGDNGGMFNCNFNESYYNYPNVCVAEKSVYPIMSIHDSDIYNDDDYIIICDVTPLVKNITVSIYDVTSKITLYKQFSMSSKDLTSSFTVNDLKEGEYQIVLDYAGDSFYSATSANNLFKIAKNSSCEINITENLVAGDNATINVTLNESATGRVRITLSDYTLINELVDGRTSFNIPHIKGGINTYKIKYEGDDNYNPIYITDTFKVLYKSNLKLNLKENSIYGEDIPVTYTITPNCIGNISIFVDNVFKTNITVGASFELENIDAGEHNVTVIYNGDEYFSKSNDSITLMISKADPTIKVNSTKWPGDVSFEISLNETATGIVTLILDEINLYPGNLTNGKINIVVPNLNAGNHSVKLIYTGCKNYNNKTYITTITIDKIPTTVMGTVDDITFTENVTINVKCDVDGIAVVKIDETYIKNINVIANTIASVTFENIPVGKHDVTVTLKPTNANYNESKYNTNFTVSKKETTVNLNVVDSVYGEDVIVNVTASEDGKVILKVGSITCEKNVLANTLTKFNFGVLAANSYNVELNFNAGENYKPSTKNDNIVISPAKAEILILQAENNVYGDNTIIKVKTNVDGALTFNVGSITRSFDIAANKLTSFNFGILDAKTYAVEVNLDAGNNYTKSINTSQVTIGSKQTTVNVSVKNSVYGENVIVNVSACENGEISVNMGDITKYINVEANKVTSVDFGILDVNSYNVYVSFDGGNNFKKSYNNAFLIVSPAKSQITEIQAPNNSYGENTIIRVKSNVDGVLTAKINTITNEVNLNANQLTSIDFGILDANNYELELSFNAGNNYIPTTVAKTFKVLKLDPTISVAVTNATYGQAATIVVNSDAEGNATIEIGSVKTYNNVLFKNNMIIQDVRDIDAGTYSVKVIYNGNNNYNIKTYDTKLTINKASTTTMATVEDIIYTKNALINVKGSVDGIAIVKIDETFIKNINVMANIITPVAFENISVGKHNVTITLKPTGKNYEESTCNIDFTVSKKETTVDLNVVDYVYGMDVIVNVTASEDGKIILKVGDITHEKNVLANIQTTINFGILSVNSYDVEVSFNAGDNYIMSTQQKSFTITPAKSEITSIQVQNNTYGENIILDVKTNVAGVLTVKINNGNSKTFNIDANKLTSLDLGKYDAGTYNIDLTLDAGSNYTKATGNAEVTVNPKQTTVELNVNDDIYGKNVIVNVTASENGKVTVNMGANVKTVDVEANKVTSVDFGILDVYSYNVHVSFDGGNNFKKSYNNAFLIVSPAKSQITEIQAPNNSYGENTIIRVKTNVDGVLTAKINTIAKEVNLNANQLTSIDFGSLDANNYELELSFNAGNNYIPTTVTKTFKVLKTDPTISIGVTNATYGQAATIIVNCNAEGNATIEIGSVKTYNNVLFKNNRIIQDVIDIDAGSYSVKVTYNGNNNYNAKTFNAKLTINKASTSVVGTVEDIDYTQNAQIKVKSSADGIAVVKIDENLIKNVNVVVNTVVPVTFENIPAGKHNVTITLKPTNANYDESTYNTDFTVSKKDASVFLNVIDSIYGDDVIVNIITGEDGKVVLKVGGITHEKNILANTPTKFNLGVLAVNSYNVEVSFDAGENYNIANKQSTFAVTPAKSEITSIQVQDNIYGENTVINVKTSVAGVLTVKINNIEKTFNIDANKLTSLDLDKYDAGTYNIELSLDAGVNYTKATSNTKVTIVPKQTTISVNADDSVYGNNVIVKVIASENGKVTLEIGNIVKLVDVEANKVTSVDFGILDVNSYEVVATFYGGKNFNTSHDKNSFSISPKKSSVTLVNFIDNHIYSESVVINAKADVDGSLTVKVGDKTQTKQATAGNMVSFDFGILNVNNYEISISLNAGNNYISYQNTTSISITPKSTSVILNTKEFNNDEKVIVNVTASENGSVAIKLGSIIKTVNVNANVLTSVDFGILGIGSYDVIANFTAGNNYIDSSDSGNVTVLSKIDNYDVNISIPKINANEENVIAIDLPLDATGTITLKINGKNYVSKVDNGKSNIKSPKLGAGNYDYSITYSGDSKYASFTQLGIISVKSKVTPNVVIGDVKVGKSVDVTINVANATGEVLVIVDDDINTVKLENGNAIHTIKEVTAGKHKLTAVYLGDDLYESSYVVKEFGNSVLNSEFKNLAVSGSGVINVVLMGSDGMPIANEKVSYTINGVGNTVTSDKNGNIVIVAKSNTFVEIKYEGNEKFLPTTTAITLKDLAPIKAATVIEGNNYAQNAIEYYTGERGGNFTVQLKDASGKVLANKKVLIGYNGKCLERTTDENGYARVQINLVAENRLTFAVAFLGDDEYNATMSVYLITINKKSVSLSVPSKSFKSSAKTKLYTVSLSTVKGVDGKTYLGAGKKVTLNINGLTYTSKTNANGQATFKLDISKKGTYTATVNYAGDNTYNAAKTTSKIKIN